MTNRLREDVDFYWLSSGDLCLDSERGDIKDTSRYNYRSTIQRILTRVMSKPGDWRVTDNMGANLEQFLGRPNDQETGLEIQSAVYYELVANDFLRPNEVEVEVFPLSKTQVVIIVKVTPANQRDAIKLIFSYDARDNIVVPRNL